MDKRIHILLAGAICTPLVVAAVEWDMTGSLHDLDLLRMAVSAGLWSIYVAVIFAIATMKRPLPNFFLVWFTVAAPLFLREVIRAVFHYQGMGWWWGLVSGGVVAASAVLISLLFDSLGWLGTAPRNSSSSGSIQQSRGTNHELPGADDRNPGYRTH